MRGCLDSITNFRQQKYKAKLGGDGGLSTGETVYL